MGSLSGADQGRGNSALPLLTVQRARVAAPARAPREVQRRQEHARLKAWEKLEASEAKRARVARERQKVRARQERNMHEMHLLEHNSLRGPNATAVGGGGGGGGA